MSNAPVTTRAIPARTIKVRRPGLSFDEMPKHFVADDPMRSHIAAMLSAVFPEGEDFFVRSVRNYRDRVTDPELKAQVAGFIGQEALHGREHRHFNERLAELGYPTRFVDRQVKHGLWVLGRVAPKPVQLAVTAGLEHYTATLAETLLRHETAMDEFATDEIRTLFSWHALEESEHKSVAFDVYQQMSGNQFIRRATMRVIHVSFATAMAATVALSIARDRTVRRRPRALLRSVRALRTHPFASRDTLRRLRDYDRRDFHPDDHDTSDLLVQWRGQLAGLSGAA